MSVMLFFICLKFWNWKIKNLLSKNDRFLAEIRKIAKENIKIIQNSTAQIYIWGFILSVPFLVQKEI